MNMRYNFTAGKNRDMVSSTLPYTSWTYHMESNTLPPLPQLTPITRQANPITTGGKAHPKNTWANVWSRSTTRAQATAITTNHIQRNLEPK